jgi:hypothetical protein
MGLYESGSRHSITNTTRELVRACVLDCLTDESGVDMIIEYCT